MDETIISGSELKFPFLSQGTKSKDLYNQFFPHPTKYTHFINNPISPNLTTMSYKIGEYMKEVYGVTDEEVGFLWDLYRERVKSQLNKFLEKLIKKLLMALKNFRKYHILLYEVQSFQFVISHLQVVLQ